MSENFHCPNTCVMQRILFDINDDLSPCRQRIHNIRFQGLSQASVHAWRQRLTSYVSEPIHPLVMKYLVDEQSTLDAIQLRMLRPYFPVVELRDRAASMRVKLCWRLAASVAILYRELDRGFLCPAVFLDALPVEELDPAHFSYDKEIGLFRILLHPRVALQPPEDSICVSSLATGPCSSPEVLQGFPGNTQSVMWTLGCLLYMLCCGHYPFGESRAQVLPTILSTFGPSASIKRASALIAKVPPVIRPLLQRLLVYKPSERLTPAELLALPEVHELLSKLSHVNRTLPHPVVISSLFHPPLDAPQPLVVPYWLQKSLNGRSDGLSSVTENSLESVLLDLPDYLPIAQCGSNGVYEGFVLKNRTTGGHVFCKVYRVGDDSATQRVIAGYFAEIASVSHPYIVPLAFAKISPLNTYAYEAVESDPLYRFDEVMESLDGRGLCEQKAWSLLGSITDVLCKLQARPDAPIYHHAIRPQTIYLTQEGALRLLDTGSARRLIKRLAQMPKYERLTVDETPDPFTAPELCTDGIQTWVGGSRADLWELAQTICYFCLGDTIACSTPADAQMLLRGRFLGPLYSDELHSVLAGMLQPDPVVRTALSELAAHPCIQRRLRPDLVYDTLYRSPLQNAIFSCDEALVLQRMLEDAGHRDAQGCTALFLAAQHGMHQILDLLVGAEADITDSKGRTALMAAAANNHVSCIDRLLPFQRGRQDANGDTALIYAARFQATEALSVLRTEARLQNGRGETALMVAAASDYAEGVEILLLYEARTQTKDGWTALMYAAVAGAASAVHKLSTVEARLRNIHGRTALIEAVLCGQETSVHALASLEHGAVDEAGRCALMYAANRGCRQALEMLRPLEGGITDPSGQGYQCYEKADCLL